MVKTRHSGEQDDILLNDFVSLPPRRTRRNQHVQNEMNGYDEDDEMEGDDQDSSEDSGTITYKTLADRSKVKAIVDSASGEDDPPYQTRRRTRRSAAQSSRGREPDVSTGYAAHYSTRARDRRLNHEFTAAFDGDLHGLRRSSRQRKLIYDNMNDAILDKNMQAIIAASQGDGEASRSSRRTRKRRRESLEEEEVGDRPDEEVDMYSRVKRLRRRAGERSLQRLQEASDEEKESGENEDEHVGGEEEEGGSHTDESDSSSSSSEDEVEQMNQPRSYYLREHKPRTELYEAPAIEPRRAKGRSLFRADTPPPSRKPHRVESTHMSPARKTNFFRRKKRTAFHGSSSTSSSGDSSDDEERFERRKSKSMAKARQRCFPMNFSSEDMAKGILRDRAKVGASLADIDPMTVDRSITFESVGGLGKHVRALKEMVVFPLLYPEVFERFKIQPPRGVLFYGPPGTGKTLVARALANECSHGERKVAFFMRKGADCLSKWVGESERQLRLLFDQAYQTRPSIIFFDEIDGLAPVRSSRQDQIHSSIVSTLLALMDGLDNRGEVVVIGATNRIDSIDPALRRPGRFDREFLFPLPSVQARKQILQIQTKEWNPKLSEVFLAEVAERCVGYCGADLKALCTEAALHALRRRYPQIYTSQDKLELDVSSIDVSAKDFHRATQAIVPTTQRSMTSPARSLVHHIRPLLSSVLGDVLQMLQVIFPDALAQIASVDVPASSSSSNPTGNGDSVLEDDLYSDDDDNAPSIFESARNGRRRRTGEPDLAIAPYMSFTSSAHQRPATHRPRLLLAGHVGQGQSTHLGPAVLHHLEKLPVHVLDLPSLYGISAKTPEESCAQIFREARRTSPSIIYMPSIDQWWDVTNDTLRATFLTLLQGVEPSTPLLLLATSDVPHEYLPLQIKCLFSPSGQEVIEMINPTQQERKQFFEDLLLRQTTRPPATARKAAQRVLEVLPKAKPVEPRQLTECELKKLRNQEEATLRELRLFLRDVVSKLGRDRKFAIFTKPVDEEEVPDYYQIIGEPMDLASMMSKIDLHKYGTVAEFMDDIDLICHNALEYNPASDPQGRAIRHRACALRDTASAIMTAELDSDFEKLCEEIKETRQRRNEDSSTTVPKYYHTKPPERMANFLNTGANLPPGYPSRFSRRARGMAVENGEGNKDNTQQLDVGEDVEQPTRKYRTIVKRVVLSRGRSKGKQSPWCRPTRRKVKKMVFYIDENGQEYPASKVEFDLEGNLKVKETAEDKEEHSEDDEDEEEEEEEDGEEKTEEKSSETPNNRSEAADNEDDVLHVQHGPDPTKYRTVVRKVVLSRKCPVSKSRSPWCRPTKRRYRNVVFYIDKQGREYEADSVIIDDHGNVKPNPKEEKSPKDAKESSEEEVSEEDDENKNQEEETEDSKTPAAQAVDAEKNKPAEAKPAENSRTSPRSCRSGSSPARASGKSPASPRSLSPMSDHSYSTSPLPKAQQARESQPKASPEHGDSKEAQQKQEERTPERRDRSPRDQRARKHQPGETAATVEMAMDISSSNEDKTKESPPILNNKDSPELKESESVATGKEVENSEHVDAENNADKEDHEAEESHITPKRMTRSQTGTSLTRKSLEELRRPPQEVVIDQEKLHSLLELTVSVTEGFNIEKLERVYSVLSQAIFRHRQAYDKSQLLQDLDSAISRFTGE